MAQEPHSPWHRATWREIGRVLLAHGGVPMTATDIAKKTRKDQSNTRKLARAMARHGLIDEVRPNKTASSRGRPPETAFALAEQHVESLEEALTASIEPGTLRRGQQLVLAEASSDGHADLLDALTEAGFGARGRWSALIDGDRQEYVMVFEGEDAARDAIDLMGMLAAAEMRCRRITVTDVLPAHELVARSRETARNARRLRLRRETRRAAEA
jgi:hypothetical protein